MELCEAAEVSSELRVGSIIAYKCLEAEGATTSWQVGTVLALPSSSDNNVAAGGTVTGCKNFKPAKYEAKVSESSLQRGDRADDSADDAKQHVATAVANPPSEPASVCQGLLVQPWVSLSSGAAGGGSGSNRSSPSLQGYVRTPTARFTEMSSMHMYLKEDKRFTIDGDGDGDVGVLSLSPASGTSSRLKSAVKGDDEDNRRFAGELSLACPRRLSFISQSKTCRSPRSDDHGSDEDSHAGVDGESNAELGAHQIEERLVQLDRRIDEVLSDVQRTRQKQRELGQMQKAARHSLRSAERLFRDARKKVQCIDKRHLCELQSYRVPPMMVRLVMHAVLFVLGERAMSWADVVAAMRNPSFIPNVVSFDPAQLSPAKVKELKRTFISNPRFSHADALQGSHALGQFHDWVMRQVQLIEAGSTDSKMAAGQVEIRNALAVARKRMKEDVALLQHLEERVEGLMCEHARLLEVRPASTRSAWTLESKTSSSGHPSPLTNVLARSFDSQGRTAPDQPGFDHLPIQSVSGAEPPALSTTPRCTPVAELGEATETSNTPAVLSGSGAQQPASTFATGVAAPTGGASALHIGVDQKVITVDAAMTNDRIEGVYHHPSAAILADGQQSCSSVPPGNQWMCPQPAVLPCTYVPRCNILCVFGHQQLPPGDKLRETTSDQSTASPPPHWRFPTPPQPLGPGDLSGTLQQVSPLSVTPSVAAALQTGALPVNLATHHTKQFAGQDWGDVVTRSPAEVHQAALGEARSRHAKELQEAQRAAVARAEQQLQTSAKEAVEERDRQLRAAQAALEEERSRHAKELQEAQTAAAARAEQQLQTVAQKVQGSAQPNAGERIQASGAVIIADDTVEVSAVEELASCIGRKEEKLDLASILERVRAVPARLRNACYSRVEHQVQRAAEPVIERARIAKVTGVVKAVVRQQQGAAMFVKMSCDDYKTATCAYLRCQQCSCMNICHGVLLVFALATLEYKKYRV